MKEQKIRENYPNIKSNEEFEKICKMLKNKRNERIAIIAAMAIMLPGAMLYTVNQTIAVACVVAGIVLWIIGTACWGRHVDEYALATARRKKVENRIVLDEETVRAVLKKTVWKELGTDLAMSVSCGLLCLIVWGFYMLALDENDTEVPVLVFFVLVPLVVFGIIRIGTIISRKGIKNTNYVFLQTKIIDRKIETSSDPESSSESYYFSFDCAEYGVLDYETSKFCYHAAYVGEDKYYLVVVKRRFVKEYKVVGIFAAEAYDLSSELEETVRVI